MTTAQLAFTLSVAAVLTIGTADHLIRTYLRRRRTRRINPQVVDLTLQRALRRHPAGSLPSNVRRLPAGRTK